jgi:hypothetical protein
LSRELFTNHSLRERPVRVEGLPAANPEARRASTIGGWRERAMRPTPCARDRRAGPAADHPVMLVSLHQGPATAIQEIRLPVVRQSIKL